MPIADIAVFIQSVGAEYSNARDITVEGMRAYSKMAHKRRNLAAKWRKAIINIVL